MKRKSTDTMDERPTPFTNKCGRFTMHSIKKNGAWVLMCTSEGGDGREPAARVQWGQITVSQAAEVGRTAFDVASELFLKVRNTNITKIQCQKLRAKLLGV